MSYKKQLEAERVKKQMYDLMATKPCTRKQLIRELNLGVNSVANHISRMVLQGYLNISPIKALEKGPIRTKYVSQYVANPRKPFEPKKPKELAKETVQRFSLGRKKKTTEPTNPNLRVYNLLDKPLPRPVEKPKRRVVSIGSSFSMPGW